MKTVLKNIKFNIVGQLVIVLLSIIGFKVLYKGYGEDLTGVIYFSVMLSSLFSAVFDLGISKTVIREIARYKEDKEYAVKLIRTFSFVYIAVYIAVVCLLLTTISLIVNNWINVQLENKTTIESVLSILIISSMLVIPTILFQSILAGMERMDISNIVEVSAGIAQQAGVILIVMNGGAVIYVAIYMLMVNTAKQGIYIGMLSNYFHLNAFAPVIYKEVLGRVRSYTGKMIWASLAVMLHKQSDKIIVSKLLPIGDVGVYSLLYSMVGKISLITSGIAQAFFPVFSKEASEKGVQQYNRMFNLAQEFLVYGILPLFIFMSIFAHPILEYVVGQAKAGENYIVVVFLSIYFYLNAAMRLIRAYIFGAKDPGIVIKADFLAFFITAPVLFLAVFYFGLKGAAASLILYYIVIGLAMLGKAYLSIFNTNATIWLKQVSGALGISMIVYMPIMLSVNLLSSDAVLIQLAAFCIATVFYYFALTKFTSVQFLDSVMLKLRVTKS